MHEVGGHRARSGMVSRWRYLVRTVTMSSLLTIVMLGLAACGEATSTSTTMHCPPRPLSGRAEDWVQAPGEVALALPYTVFGTNERVQGAVFNHTQGIIETTQVYGRRCAVF